MGGVHDSRGLCSLHHSGDEATRGSVLWNRMLLRGLDGVVTLFRQYLSSLSWRALCSDIGKESNFEFSGTCIWIGSCIILALISIFDIYMWSKSSSKLVYQLWIWFFLNSSFFRYKCICNTYYLFYKPTFSIVGLDLDKFIKFDPQVSQNICVSIHNFILIIEPNFNILVSLFKVIVFSLNQPLKSYNLNFCNTVNPWRQYLFSLENTLFLW